MNHHHPTRRQAAATASSQLCVSNCFQDLFGHDLYFVVCLHDVDGRVKQIWIYGWGHRSRKVPEVKEPYGCQSSGLAFLATIEQADGDGESHVVTIDELKLG